MRCPMCGHVDARPPLADLIVLEQTCPACPEQYDAKLDGVIVGCLRLRHGHFSVDFPACGGETILSATPRGDGCFESDERDFYLRAAQTAIAAQIMKARAALNNGRADQ